AIAAAFVAAVSITTTHAQKLLITGKRPMPMIESIGPQVTRLALPEFDGAHAIWGSTGQDSSGHLWFGVTAEGTSTPSAHWFEYALGYFGHVLFRFDTNSREIRRVPIGSVSGHVSRNFVADYRGHAYVPRLRFETETLGRRTARVSIVELGTSLEELKETPL